MSIIEIIIAIAILGLIIGAVGAFQRDVFYLGSALRGTVATTQDARAIIRTMTQELREASVSSNGSYTIESAATSSVVFYSNIDSDVQKERIRYFMVGKELRKGVIQPTGSPVSYPSNSENFSVLISTLSPTTTPMFEYYNTSYAGTSTPMTYPIATADIRLVRFNLILDVDVNRAPVPRVYTTQVTIRNLKDNL